MQMVTLFTTKKETPETASRFLIDKLFDELKDSNIFTTTKNGQVRRNSQACRGEYYYLSTIIEPKVEAPEKYDLGYDFVLDTKIAKELRRRIADWRMDNPDAPIYVRMEDMKFAMP